MDLLYDYEKLASMTEDSYIPFKNPSSSKKIDRKREFFQKYRNRYTLINILSFLNSGEVFNTFYVNKLTFKTFLIHKEKEVYNP